MQFASWMLREPDPSTTGNAAPASRAGAGPTTRALPPARDQALDAQRSLPVEIDSTATADAQYELNRTAAQLQRLALDVAASRVAHAEAVTLAETLCLGAAGAVRRLASAKEQRARAGAQREADARSLNPFVSGPASRAQDASQQGEESARRDDAATTKHLDRIASGAMQVMRECGRAEGGYRIAASELFRAFPPCSLNSSVNGSTEQTLTPELNSPNRGLEREIEILREERDRERRQFEDTIDDLRRRLDAEGEERRKLTAMLTDQRAREAAPEVPQAAREGRLARAWSILRGKA